MTEFESLIREGVYLRGWSPRTVRIYRQAWASFGHGSDRPDAVTDQTLVDWVVSLKARVLWAPSINSYIRGLNAYLSCLRSRGVDCPRPVRQLKEPERPLKTVPVERLKGMLKRPCTSYTDHRMQTLLALLLDTGIRIPEALDLRVHDVDLDLDHLLLTVTGKEQKTRVVPLRPFAAEIPTARHHENETPGIPPRLRRTLTSVPFTRPGRSSGPCQCVLTLPLEVSSAAGWR
jgi:site-specific recombinase XerD